MIKNNFKIIELKPKKHKNSIRRTVFIKDFCLAEGWGGSIKQAEKDAANEALKSLKKDSLITNKRVRKK